MRNGTLDPEVLEILKRYPHAKPKNTLLGRVLVLSTLGFLCLQTMGLLADQFYVVAEVLLLTVFFSCLIIVAGVGAYNLLLFSRCIMGGPSFEDYSWVVPGSYNIVFVDKLWSPRNLSNIVPHFLIAIFAVLSGYTKLGTGVGVLYLLILGLVLMGKDQLRWILGFLTVESLEAWEKALLDSPRDQIME